MNIREAGDCFMLREVGLVWLMSSGKLRVHSLVGGARGDAVSAVD